jgi:predicted RNase H-like nuclease (RuvC/YqgF family)
MNEIEINAQMKHIKELSDRHLELDEKIKALKAEDDFIKDQIKIISEGIGIDTFEDDEYYLTIKTQTQKRLDNKLLEQLLDAETLQACYKEGNPFSVIRWVMKK